MKVYSVKEAAKIIGIKPRAVQFRCKRDDVRKKDNKYLITDLLITSWIDKKKKSNAISNANANAISSANAKLKVELIEVENAKLNSQAIAINEQVDLQVQSLELEIEKLKEENRKLKLELTKEIPHQEKLKKAIQLITLEAMDKGMQHKVFSEEEYQDLIGTITEVDFQKEQVNYLRSRVEKQDEILTKLVNQASERNYIEAKEKGFDTK